MLPSVFSIIADATLPAFSICKADEFTFFTAKHPIVIPIQQIPNTGVLRTVKIHIAALGIGIACQQLERHPVGDVFYIKVRFQQLFHRLGFIVQLFQHLNEFTVVTAALILFQFDFVVFLDILAGGLTADLHCGVGCLYSITQLAGQRTVLIPPCKRALT